MPDTTNRTTDDSSTSHVEFAELETGGFAVSLNGFWLPGSFPTMPEAETAAGAAIARAEPSFSELIHQAADVRETLFRAAKSDRTLDNEMRFECGRAVGIIGKLAARLMAEVNAPPALHEGLRETLVAALTSELGDSYDCGRVWEAWNIGTMSEDDFTPISDRVDEIADGIIIAIGKAHS